MTLYSVALFIHVVGALLLFAAFTAEGIGIFHLRRATTSAQVRDWDGVAGLARVFGPASVVAILLPGIYMMVTTWGWVPWIAVALFAWFTVALLGATNGIRLSLLLRRAVVDESLVGRLRSPQYVVSWSIRLAIGLGIVLLMTNKPDLVWSLVAIVAAAAIGGGAGLVASRA